MQDFLDNAWRRLNEARQHQSAWRKEAREDFDFVAGRQWDSADEEKLKAEMRPCITFNRTQPIIDTVGGMEVTNRQMSVYKGREETDGGVAELATATADWIRDRCDAEDEESDAFLDAAICGLGWTETRISYDEDIEGQILIERVDPLEMWWDPSAKKRNLSDARYVFRAKRIPRHELYDMFPEAPEDLGSDELDLEGTTEIKDNPRNQYQTGDDINNDDQLVTLVEYQWCEKVPVHVVANPQTGELLELEPERFKALKKAMPDVKSAQRKKARYMRAFFTGQTILSGPEPTPCPYGFSYLAIAAKRDRNKNSWYGLLRAMKDPQRWANKWLSQALHIINSNAKGGLLAEKSAFINPRKAEQDWAKPDAVILLQDGGLEKVKERSVSNYPASFDKLMMFAISSIRDVSGVSLELMGMVDREQAGIVENARKQSGYVILARLFDSLRKYRKEQARILYHMIQQYVPEGTIVRIDSDQGPQLVPFMKAPDTFKFDIEVDSAPWSPTQKETTWEAMSQLFPVMAKLPIPPQVWGEVLKFSPIPASSAEKITGMISQPPPPDPMVELKKGELELKNAELGLKGEETKADVQKAQIEAQIKAIELQLKAQELGVKSTEVAATVKEHESKDRMNELVGLMAQAMSQPKAKKVNIVRGPAGEIAGAEVIETPVTIQ